MRPTTRIVALRATLPVHRLSRLLLRGQQTWQQENTDDYATERVIHLAGSITESKRRIRPRNRPPHVSHRSIVVSQAFFRLFEVTPDNVQERLDCYDRLRVERI